MDSEETQGGSAAAIHCGLLDAVAANAAERLAELYAAEDFELAACLIVVVVGEVNDPMATETNVYASHQRHFEMLGLLEAGHDCVQESGGESGEES